MVSTTLNILNKGKEPTFLNVRRKQVIDITLGTTLVGNLVSDWHVSSKESLSDHRYKCLKIESQVFETVIYRNPKETHWAGYRQNLSTLIVGISKNIRSRLESELAADEMQQSYHHNCRTRLADSPRKVPRWSIELSFG